MLFIIFIILANSLFSLELVPTQQLNSLPIEKRIEEIHLRYFSDEWGGLNLTERLTILNRAKSEAFQKNLDQKTYFLEILYLFHLDLKNEQIRLEAKNKLEQMKPNIFRLDDQKARSGYFHLKGWFALFDGEYQLAVQLLDKALAEIKTPGYEQIVLNNSLGYAAYWADQYNKALSVAQENEKIILRYNFALRDAQNHELLGDIYLELDEFAKASDSLFKSLEIYNKRNNLANSVTVLTSIALNKTKLNKYDDALSYYLEAEKFFDREEIFYSDRSLIYNNMASIHRIKKEFKKALSYSKKAILISEENNDFTELIGGKITHIDIIIEMGRAKEALELLEEVKEIDDKYWLGQYKAWYQKNLAKAYYALNQHNKAKPFVKRAIALTEKNDDINLEKTYEFAIKFYKETKNFEELGTILEKLMNWRMNTSKEKSNKLLYTRENKNLALKNKQNELILENQKTKTLMLSGFVFAFFLIMLLQYNRNQVIKRKEALVREKTNDLQSVLDNIHQGVVTVDLLKNDSQKIKDTSLHFFKIFEHLDDSCLLESNSILDLFVGSSLNNEDLSKINSVLISATHENLWQWEVNCENLPREMSLNDSQKIIEIDWDPVTDEEVVHKIILTFKDVSEFRRLGEEKAKNERDIKKLISLSQMDQKEYSIFITSVDKMLDENLSVLEPREDYHKDAIDLVFRNLHTIKGLARSYDMMLLSGFIHEVESSFQKTRDKIITYSRESCLAQLEQVQTEINNYRALAKTNLKWDLNISEVSMPVNQLVNWYDHISKFHRNKKDEDALNDLLHDIKRKYSTTFSDTLKNIMMNSQKLSKELKKGEVTFKLVGCDLFVTKDYEDKISTIFVHLIRNSIDHGFVNEEKQQQYNLSSPHLKSISFLMSKKESFRFSTMITAVGFTSIDSVKRLLNNSSLPTEETT